MTPSAEERRKRMIAIGLGAAAFLFIAYRMYDLFGGGSSAPPPPPVIVTSSASPAPSRTAGKSVTAPPGAIVGQSALKVGSGGTKLDPTLHEEAMLVTESLVYSGSGRNIFAPGNEMTVIDTPKPVAPARTIAQTVVPPPVHTGPPPTPPPPPINLKFFGTTASVAGVRRAFLLNGDDVFLASQGDVVQRRYRVVSISANSILIEDIPNTNKQTLPLMGN